MTMSVETYRANLKFLDDHGAEYPFACHTRKQWPWPEDVSRSTRLDFISAPLAAGREWRFRTKAERARFKQHYTTIDNRV